MLRRVLPCGPTQRDYEAGRCVTDLKATVLIRSARCARSRAGPVEPQVFDIRLPDLNREHAVSRTTRCDLGWTIVSSLRITYQRGPWSATTHKTNLTGPFRGHPLRRCYL
jgi:hypothetical protein